MVVMLMLSLINGPYARPVGILISDMEQTYHPIDKPDGTPDHDYTICLEYVGENKNQYVARHKDRYVGCASNIIGAALLFENTRHQKQCNIGHVHKSH